MEMEDVLPRPTYRIPLRTKLLLMLWIRWLLVIFAVGFLTGNVGRWTGLFTVLTQD